MQNTQINPIPYMNQSQIQIQYHGESTYERLLQNYDPALHRTLSGIASNLIGQKIFIFMINLQPEDLSWRTWKSSNQITDFLRGFKNQIDEVYEINNSENAAVCNLYDKLQGQGFSFDANNMHLFLHFINAVARNSYLNRSEQFLIFIDHCVPIDKWNMLIFKQMVVYKEPGVVDKAIKMFNKSSTPQRDYFLTISRDGILKSDNHLLESRISFMIPFNRSIQIQCKQNSQNQITYVVQSCAHEQLVIKFYKFYERAINFVVSLRMALDHTSYCGDNRFQSYSPVRRGCASKLYVDGAEYYEDMYEELIKAKKQVCITGWMITPYFLLKRPNSIDSREYRLDGVLQKIAQRGVKVYIIVFMEPKLFVNNDSQHVQMHLQSLHDNIKVYRHPNGAIPLLWSHHQKMVIIDQQIGFMGGLDICYGRWDYYDHPLIDPGTLWDGADYNNYRTRDITNPRDFKNTNLDKNFQVRMPWHDIALQFRGDVVLDLLRHFVQYWYFVKVELGVDPLKFMNFLKRRYQQAFYNATNQNSKNINQYYVVQISKKQQAITIAQKMKYMMNGREERLPQLLIETKPGNIVGNENLQMCRSASIWSIGMYNHQSSIHNAYQELIKNSEKFIYIQNQFFMGLQNKIVECLIQRIKRADQRKENFKIIVVMPLLPGFEGNIADPASTVLRIQVHHQYQAISRGPKSLFEVLRLCGIQAENYIHYFGLRTCELIGSSKATQIIYVHSKLMIVDDKRCIIGSANINDRSLLGNRDSQLACIIEENNGNIFNLRARIFKEHFDLDQEGTARINQPQVWNYVINNSRNATLFYHKFFRCIPSDNVKKGSDVNSYFESLENYDIETFNFERKNLKGHAVEFPLFFMGEEDLTFRMGQKQYFAPEQSFT